MNSNELERIRKIGLFFMEKSINKDSFILFKEHEEIFKQLSKEQAGELILAIFEYERTEIIPELEFCINLAFTPIRQSLDRSREKYKEVCKKNSQNAQKRWSDKNTTANDCKKQNAKDADSENENEPDYDSENDNNISFFEKNLKNEENPSERIKTPFQEENRDIIEHLTQYEWEKYQGLEGYQKREYLENKQEAFNKKISNDETLKKIKETKQNSSSPLDFPREQALKYVQDMKPNFRHKSIFCKELIQKWGFTDEEIKFFDSG